ncbi:MAG TPA: hypothetical protein VFO40_19345, partial [Chthoniobacterales bacterium]|nr:hypothetical protein [Chthoniobacterales bacterium]
MWENAKTIAIPVQHSERSDRSKLPDPLSYRRSDGSILRLPDYLPRSAFVEVDRCSGFQIRAKPLFPLIQPIDTQAIAQPRFLLQIRSNGVPCYVRRYV